jgi:hypothetical protein
VGSFNIQLGGTTTTAIELQQAKETETKKTMSIGAFSRIET